MPPTRVLCNNPHVRYRKNVLRLSYYPPGDEAPVRIALPRFVDDVLHVPDTVLDLLEIAAYVYAVDRLEHRGSTQALEFHAWARNLEFHIAVRDEAAWSRPELIKELESALQWVTGDARFSFRFYGGHATPPTGLFDAASVSLAAPAEGLSVIPFSGGLDSLAGAVHLLSRTKSRVCLVSHQSQSRTKKTQDGLVRALARAYPGRVHHYAFRCNLRGARAPEESQRSRSFLFCAIAFAIAHAYGQDRIYVFENGVTSLNFRRRQDLLNSRASRTTHPQSLGRIERIFQLLTTDAFKIEMPFLWYTKADVLETLVSLGAGDFISSAVSCTRTMQASGLASHCGECFQCIDRRIASFAAGVDDIDHPGLYNMDVVTESPSNAAAQTTIVDYLRQARAFARISDEQLTQRYTSELTEIVDWIPESIGELEKVERVADLARRHSERVHSGLTRMRNRHENLFEPLKEGSLLQLISAREHTKPEVARLVESIARLVESSVAKMFRGNPPANENDFNQKLGALLGTHFEKLRSEHPLARFACAGVVPDHELDGADVLIESKYIRNGTPPSRASGGIAEDLVKYPPEKHVVFVVLDLGAQIRDPTAFRRDFESRRKCTVLVVT